MAYCSSCGTEFPDGAAFCSKCGKVVEPAKDKTSGRRPQVSRTSLLAIVGLAVILLAIGTTAAIGGFKPSSHRPTYHSVVYEITGNKYTDAFSAKYVDVTLSNSEGGTEQYSDVAVPARYSYPSFPGKFLYISAQNQGESGTVTVSIYVNGDLFRTSTSSGAYVIATASGYR